MWLTGRLAARLQDDRRLSQEQRRGDPGGCSQFVVLCRKLGLFTRAVVAIDGSKFKAVNNRDKNYTAAKVIGRMEQVDASIARYLRALDRADREERCRRGQIGPAEREDCRPAPADAVLEGDGAES